MTTIIACVEPGLKQAVLIAFEIKPKASTEFPTLVSTSLINTPIAENKQWSW